MIDFKTRTAGAEDRGFIRDLFVETRRDEFAMLPPEVAGPILDMQFTTREAAYRAQFPDAADAIIENADERPCGRLLTDRRGDEIHIVDIAIAAEFRGSGIGGAVVESLKASASRVTLSVYHGNTAAIRFYERHGFAFVEGGSPNAGYFQMEFENV